MFSTPLPRTSFLDSSLRTRSLENRRLSRTHPVGTSHLGHGQRQAPARPALHKPLLEEAPRFVDSHV